MRLILGVWLPIRVLCMTLTVGEAMDIVEPKPDGDEVALVELETWVSGEMDGLERRRLGGLAGSLRYLSGRARVSLVYRTRLVSLFMPRVLRFVSTRPDRVHTRDEDR